jgi:hypothetical protein
MTADARLRLLRFGLTVFGLLFIFGLTPLTLFWPAGWRLQPDQPVYLQMLLGIYGMLGVFLLVAARDPERHTSLIWFTVWSSLVQVLVKGAHALTDPAQAGHLWGDVSAMLLVAVVLGLLAPRTPGVRDGLPHDPVNVGGLTRA